MNKYFEIEKINDLSIIRILFSELSMEEAEEFKSHLYSLITDKNEAFVINMAKCDFLPSIALGVFVGFNTKAREKSGKVSFCCLPEKIKRIFIITKLDKIFEIYETRIEAIEAFK